MARKKQQEIKEDRKVIDQESITSVGVFSKIVEDMIMLDSRDENLRNLLFEKIREINGESS